MDKKLIGYELIKDYPHNRPDFKVGFIIKSTKFGENGWGSMHEICEKYPEFWKPVYKENNWKDNLKISDWVYMNAWDKSYRISNSNNDSYKDGMHSISSYNCDINWAKKYCTRLATKDEILNTLVNVAESKGFKENTTYNPINTNTGIIVKDIIYKVCKIDHWNIFDHILCNRGNIYNNFTDTWAAIIHNEITTILHASNNNYTFIITKDYFIHKNDGKKMSVSEWKYNLDKMDNHSLGHCIPTSEFEFKRTFHSTIDIGCGLGITLDEIKRIYKLWQDNFGTN